jgi:DNA sulfur modification protein DndE
MVISLGRHRFLIVKQVRLSDHAKSQLSRLKYKTGINNWNVLCRWALCCSLREATKPVDMDIQADSNVEMSWHVFGGEYDEVYDALIRQRCINDGLGTEPEVLAKYFRLHLHRGIQYLLRQNYINSIFDLIDIAIKEKGSSPSSEMQLSDDTLREIERDDL